MENFLRENVDESSLKLIVDDNESLTINVNDDPDDMYNYQDFNIDNYENYEKILIYEFKKIVETDYHNEIVLFCEHCFKIMIELNAPLVCGHNICSMCQKYSCPLYSLHDFYIHRKKMGQLNNELKSLF